MAKSLHGCKPTEFIEKSGIRKMEKKVNNLSDENWMLLTQK